MSEQVTAVSRKDNGRVERIHLQLHEMTARVAALSYRGINHTYAEPDTLRYFAGMVPYSGPNPIAWNTDPTDPKNYLVNTNPTAKEMAMLDNGETLTRSFCQFA